MYLGHKGGIGVEFDCHIPDLFSERRSARRLFGLGNDGRRDFTPVTLTTNVLTLDSEFILKALNQASYFIVSLHNLLCGHRHPFVLLLLTFLQEVVGNFSSTITAWRLPTNNTGVFGGANDERLLGDSRFFCGEYK